jgi:peroxiredoxin
MLEEQRNGSHGTAPVAAILEPGATAPDFTLRSAPDRWTSLADTTRRRPLIMAFYPADWSPVCGDQLTLYSEVLEEFRRFGAELVGVSVDGVWCHQAYRASRRLRFPLLSDFEPKGEVARRYGVYDAGTGEARRALFVIDAGGVVRWSHLSPVDVNPGADGILRALAALTTGAAA